MDPAVIAAVIAAVASIVVAVLTMGNRKRINGRNQEIRDLRELTANIAATVNRLDREFERHLTDHWTGRAGPAPGG